MTLTPLTRDDVRRERAAPGDHARRRRGFASMVSWPVKRSRSSKDHPGVAASDAIAAAMPATEGGCGRPPGETSATSVPPWPSPEINDSDPFYT
jgi:hypothetical protein